MIYIIFIAISFIIIIKLLNTAKKDYYNNSDNLKNFDNEYSNYITKNYIMTQTELKFYRQLKETLKTENIDANIFPQINLERIIQVKNNNRIERNRIKSRSIDFTIVNNNNCKIICCIELDDYTHKQTNRIKRDNFINELFKSVKIKLFRIKVINSYDLSEVVKYIKEVV